MGFCPYSKRHPWLRLLNRPGNPRCRPITATPRPFPQSSSKPVLARLLPRMRLFHPRLLSLTRSFLRHSLRKRLSRLLCLRRNLHQ